MKSCALAQMDGEGLALPHGEVAHGDAPDVLQEDDAVGAEDGILFGRRATQVAVDLGAACRQRRPDAAFDGDVGVELRVGGHRLVREAGNMLVADHAGVACRA